MNTCLLRGDQDTIRNDNGDRRKKEGRFLISSCWSERGFCLLTPSAPSKKNAMEELKQFIDFERMLDYLIEKEDGFGHDAQQRKTFDLVKQYRGEVAKSANLDLDECSYSLGETIWFGFKQVKQTANESNNNNDVAHWLIGYSLLEEMFFHASKDLWEA